MVLRVAIVGCGRMGRQRAKDCRMLGVEVAWVEDVDAGRAAALAAESGATVGQLEGDPVALAGLDALLLCTPPNIRGRYVAAAARAGVPLLCEKPLARNADEAKALVELVEERQLISSVGYMNRYRDSIGELRRVAQTTPVLAASVGWIGRKYAVPWWSDPTLSGGAFNEQATHLVDAIRFALGELAEVTALKSHDGASVAVSLRTVQGSVVSLLYSCAGTEKLIHFNVYTASRAFELVGWDFGARGAPTVADPNAVFRTELDAFLKVVAGAERSLVLSDFADALRTQEAVDAVLLSLAAQRTVRLGS